MEGSSRDALLDATRRRARPQITDETSQTKRAHWETFRWRRLVNLTDRQIGISQSINKPHNRRLNITSQSALPDHEHTPAGCPQRLLFAPVALDIGFKLGQPELTTCRGSCRIAASLMAMPVAAVHKNHGRMLAQDEIRFAGQSRVMQSEPETQPVQFPTHKHLGPCILCSDAGHHSGPSASIYNINHLLMVSDQY